MKVTVLGNNGPYPGAGGACSGYLVTDGDKRILIDCGNGVLANLQKVCKIEDLDAIILTHLHSDHISDMMVLRYALDIKKRKGQLSKEIEVYAPPEPPEEYQRLNLRGIFNLIAIHKDLVLNVGKMKFTFCEMKHPYQCFGVSIESEGRRFVFSGDTAWCDSIIRFSVKADLVMLDTGLLAKDKTNENVPHLTAKECGIIARQAEVKRLLLTHFWPEYDLNEVLSEAKKEFESTVLSEILNSYEV